jgi:hypothetical protein
MTTGAPSSSSQESSAPSRTEILADDSTEDRRPPAKRLPPAEATETDTKRSKGGRTWLQFHGRRQTRVGDAYQVNALPQPSAFTVGTSNGEK